MLLKFKHLEAFHMSLSTLKTLQSHALPSNIHSSKNKRQKTLTSVSPILWPHVCFTLKVMKILGFAFTLNIQKDKNSDVLELGFELS